MQVNNIDSTILWIKRCFNWKFVNLCHCAILILILSFPVTSANKTPRRSQSTQLTSDPCKAAGYLGDIALTPRQYREARKQYNGARRKHRNHRTRHKKTHQHNNNDLGRENVYSPRCNTSEQSSNTHILLCNTTKAAMDYARKMREEKEDLTLLIKETLTELNRDCDPRVTADCFEDKDTLVTLLATAKKKVKRIKNRLRRLDRLRIQNCRKKQDPVAKQVSNIQPHRLSRRAAIADTTKLWDNGIIPFVIDSNYSGVNKDLIRLSMRHWEEKTCLVFKEKGPDDEDYVLFAQRPCGCCSNVGKIGGAQVTAISRGCYYFGTIIHEIGHLIGFWHEHNRPDRDQYVQILTENIIEGDEYNFHKKGRDLVDSRGEPYDYDSIMHYSRNKHAKQPVLDTIRPLRRPGMTHPPILGHKFRISEGDVRQTNKLYNCASCGRTVVEKKGVISHNTSLGREVACQWRIVTSHGSRVVLSLTQIDIPDCDTDYLEIRDGHFFGSPILGKFCGNEIPSTLTSSGNRMWLEFKAGVRHPGSFKANFANRCGGELSGPQGLIASPGYPDYFDPNLSCIWVISGQSGSRVDLTFEDFQTEYDQDCSRDYLELRDGDSESSPLIGRYCGFTGPDHVLSTGRQLWVKFVSDESLESTGFSAAFKIEIDECEGDEHGCEQVCVNTMGSYECACRNGFDLKSDGRGCESTCGGEIETSQGEISSPSFPNNYPPNKNCVWLIKAQEGHNIHINFSHTDIERVDSDCAYDYVRVTDVLSSGDRTKGQYCGNIVPPSFTSDGKMLKLEFHSDESVQLTGFSLNFVTVKDDACGTNNGGCHHKCEKTLRSYKCSCHSGFTLGDDGRSCLQGGCHHEITDHDGFVQSPNYPENYPPKQNCTWIFQTAPGHRIKLTFTDFTLEPHRTCRYDHVMVFDGNLTIQPSLGKYCGLSIPPPIISTGPTLTMTFFSDYSTQRKGFRAHHSTFCQGEVMASVSPQTIVSHVDFGSHDHSHYSNGASCSWKIVAPAGKRVYIRFESFDLEKDVTCGYDYVAVYDGGHTSDQVLGKFCGQRVPQPITSTGKYLLVQFTSDNTVQARGFSLSYYGV